MLLANRKNQTGDQRSMIKRQFTDLWKFKIVKVWWVIENSVIDPRRPIQASGDRVFSANDTRKMCSPVHRIRYNLGIKYDVIFTSFIYVVFVLLL